MTRWPPRIDAVHRFRSAFDLLGDQLIVLGLSLLMYLYKWAAAPCHNWRSFRARGFMFWDIADEGSGSPPLYMAASLNEFLHTRRT